MAFPTLSQITEISMEKLMQDGKWYYHKVTIGMSLGAHKWVLRLPQTSGHTALLSHTFLFLIFQLIFWKIDFDLNISYKDIKYGLFFLTVEINHVWEKEGLSIILLKFASLGFTLALSTSTHKQNRFSILTTWFYY